MSDYVSREDVTGSVEEGEDGVHEVTRAGHVPTDETAEEREKRQAQRGYAENREQDERRQEEDQQQSQQS